MDYLTRQVVSMQRCRKFQTHILGHKSHKDVDINMSLKGFTEKTKQLWQKEWRGFTLKEQKLFDHKQIV